MKRDWKQVLNDQAASREDREPRRSIAVNFPNELYSLIAAAAKSRGMNQTAYMRRAALAFAQADTGFDWVEEMQNEPGITPAGDLGKSMQGGVKMYGTGYGAWRIVGLEQHGPDD